MRGRFHTLDTIVTTDWLYEHLHDRELRVVDTRWYLDPARSGPAAFAAGHLPGAVFLSVDRDLSAPGGGRGERAGRHPWPPPEQVADVMGRAGVGPATQVVVYDDQAGATAARLWYLLRAHGHEAVAVLDGGYPRWVAEGRPVDTAVSVPTRADFTAVLREGWVVDGAQLRAEPPDLLLDARAAERYRGETEPIDPRAGHIPGAVSAPFSENLTGGPQPGFRSPEELRQRFSALGASRTEPVVYCGSGVTACHNLLALHMAGLRGRLYAGSWSEWSANPELPVATGPEPRSD